VSALRCRARTKLQYDAADWSSPIYEEMWNYLGCANKAVQWVNSKGEPQPEGRGTPVCNLHAAQWQKGRNYGVNG